jgi:hypothetical protein
MRQKDPGIKGIMNYLENSKVKVVDVYKGTIVPISNLESHYLNQVTTLTKSLRHLINIDQLPLDCSLYEWLEYSIDECNDFNHIRSVRVFNSHALSETQINMSKHWFLTPNREVSVFDTLSELIDDDWHRSPLSDFECVRDDGSFVTTYYQNYGTDNIANRTSYHLLMPTVWQFQANLVNDFISNTPSKHMFYEAAPSSVAMIYTTYIVAFNGNESGNSYFECYTFPMYYSLIAGDELYALSYLKQYEHHIKLVRSYVKHHSKTSIKVKLKLLDGYNEINSNKNLSSFRKSHPLSIKAVYAVSTHCNKQEVKFSGHLYTIIESKL